MIYPRFLKPGDRVGIPAPSAGIDESHLPEYLRSLEALRRRGWQVEETESVRSGLLPSAPPQKRAEEFNLLAEDEGIGGILCAAGGDFLVELLPYVDWEALRRSPKWVQGYSDPTGLLFPITTLLDIATVYGPNAGGYGMEPLHPALEYSLSLLEGRIAPQRSFSRWQLPLTGRPDGSYLLQRPVCWETPCGPVRAEGRLLGGCLDCLENLRGTPYEDAAGFARRYAADGIVWYFDIFAQTADQVFYSLWSMKQAGWFENARAFLFGRVMFPQGDYPAAIRRALGDAAIVWNADIGHVKPAFTLINGAMARVAAADGRGTLEMELRA